MSQKTLLLVDGSSYLFRAFHALPDLRNKDNEPTGAIHGIVGMLRRLREDTRLHDGAVYGAVVFDAPGKTFRDDMYDQYKANRSEMPDDLRRQIEPIHEISQALGWPLLVIPGIEADDVIGTLAVQARRAGMKTVISTSDKDLAQLVDDQTVLVNTMTRDGSPAQPLDAAGVLERFGVTPDRVVDFLSLTGDTVDNVPGVDKVGPKTAAKWISRYGSLDQVIAHAAEIGGKIGENLRAVLGWLPTARELVTVKTDCDLSKWLQSVEDLSLRPESQDELLGHFSRWGLRTLARRMEDSAPAGTPPESEEAEGTLGPADLAAAEIAPLEASEAAAVAEAERAHAAKVPTSYETVLTDQALSRWIDRISTAPLTAFDMETSSLDPMHAELVGVSLAVDPFVACYVPVCHRYTGAPDQLSRDHVLARLKPWLESEQHRKVGENLKYSMHVLANHGIAFAGLEHDILLQSYVLEAHRTHGMDALAARHLERRTLTFSDVAGKGARQITFDQVEVSRATEYAAEDAEVTIHLHRALFPRIEAESKLLHVYRDIELPATLALQAMERHGVLVDAGLLNRQSEEIGNRLMALEQQAYAAAGQPFNLGSPKQLCEILFTRLKLPVLKKTASGAPSTDEEVLEKLALDFPLPKILLQWRGLAKLKSTYTDKLPKSILPRTGRVHTTYSQAVAVTGRLASTEPNLQNIPIRTAEGRRIREAFIAAPGHRLMSADYSQIELRIMAHISQDQGLLKAFSEGLDVHRATAAEVFGVPVEQVSSE
ncbi:MAG: DNA polymerase I, partial [Lautropia sp.]|nr:DNA polymerase I [Lautropia sp.]